MMGHPVLYWVIKENFTSDTEVFNFMLDQCRVIEDANKLLPNESGGGCSDARKRHGFPAVLWDRHRMVLSREAAGIKSRAVNAKK